MPEVKLSLNDPAKDAVALREAVAFIQTKYGYKFATVDALRELADQIEAQLPKAPVEQLRDLLFRSPSGYLTNEETLAAYTDLRKGISDLLSGRDEADEPHPQPWYDTPEGEQKLAEWERDLLGEPTPEQVEADLAQDEQAHARYCAAGDAIEALVQEFAARSALVWVTDLRDFAARVLEVGGQQPGVPVVGK